MRSMILLPATLLIAMATGISTAGAQDTDAGRFRLEKAGDGFVRLDTRTGAMTLCREQDGALVCRSGRRTNARPMRKISTGSRRG